MNPWFPLVEATQSVGQADNTGHKWWQAQVMGFVGFDPRMTNVFVKVYCGFSAAATPDFTAEWGIVKLSNISLVFPP